MRFAKLPDAQFDDLMTEYKNLSPHLKYENVDPQEKPDVARDYGATHMDDVIVASGPHKETLQGTTEEDVTTAILKVTAINRRWSASSPATAKDPLPMTPRQGYSQADQGLKKEDYATKTINLASSTEVPSDCDVLVIAGPTEAFSRRKLRWFRTISTEAARRSSRSIRLQQTSRSSPNLGSIFQKWNINVGNNVVIDSSGMGRLLGAGPAIPLVINYGDSPITKTLQRTMTFFPLARTVSIADKSKIDPMDTELLMTSPQSFTTPKLEHEVSYNPKTDTMGPLSLGVAASDPDSKNARLVVIGDSDYASNEAIGQTSNGDLFFNSDRLARAGREPDLDSAKIPGEPPHRSHPGSIDRSGMVRTVPAAWFCDYSRNLDLVEAPLREAEGPKTMIKKPTLILLVFAIALGLAVYYFDWKRGQN